jgi:nifR3 family TIM-barrel protein
VNIGNIHFKERPLFLAPMEDVTDPAFRRFCKRFGADMVYTEFISADALIRSIARTERKLTILDEERPVAVQIYGREPAAMAEAARIAESAKPDIIDINFGCPVKKVAVKGAGAGMLRDVPKMLEITRAVVAAVNTPVTVKTRLGWDNDSKIITEIAEPLQDCGIAALAIHGRTRSQMYKGEADWTLIGEVKNNPRIHIPIIGNGDITSTAQANEMFERYGVDAVMIGRAAIGQPWIFGKNIQDNFDWQLSILKEYIEESIRWLEDERKGIIHVRRHLAVTPIFKGIPHFKETRIAMLRAGTKAELFEIFERVKENYF